MTNNNARQPNIGQGPPGVVLVPSPLGSHLQRAQSPAPGVTPGYQTSAGRWTGGIQLGCGVASVILGIINIAVRSWNSNIGTGIWTGIAFYTAAGILGLISWKKPNRCVMISYMVMSILSSVAAGIAIYIYGIDIAFLTRYGSSDYYYYYDYPRYSRGATAIVAMLIAVAAIELVTSIVAAAFCCAGTCCSPSQATAASVVYVHQAQPGGYAVPPGMVACPATGPQAPCSAPNGAAFVQQPFPMMQYPAGQSPMQWQPMVLGGQPPVGQQAQNVPMGAGGVAQAQAQAEEDKPPAYT